VSGFDGVGGHHLENTAMWRRLCDAIAAVLLGGFILVEPPVAHNSTGYLADTKHVITGWTFVSAFDSQAKCDDRRAARLANAESDLGVSAETDLAGSKLGAVWDARRASRCVPDTVFFPEKAGKK
jgi:hypothetical protein